ncbi:response regulator transcription factor [Larkinella terrae]|uniref:Response regulator n=1 Tax=Larkinella terrae TaxID=2025311 RepID=A0A7K0ESA2_9BACT|nr:response regulator transcription factor [Larkinella terrae]MRS64401.1 response regulator [Larkinella terrae]
MKTFLAIVGTEPLAAQALVGLIQKFDKYEVRFIAGTSLELIRHLNRGDCPEIVLVDGRMPKIDGYEVAAYLKLRCPAIKVLALMDPEENVVQMARNGILGYLLKNCRSSELLHALDDLNAKGYHYPDFLTDRLVRSLNAIGINKPAVHFPFSDREHAFLKMACSDLTYAQIADQMCVSTRTVDGYREALFQKMNVKSRVGMALEAVRRGLVQL